MNIPEKKIKNKKQDGYYDYLTIKQNNVLRQFVFPRIKKPTASESFFTGNFHLEHKYDCLI